MEVKTNAVRMMERKKLDYEMHTCAETGAISGMDVASALHEDPNQAFKTIVTEGKNKGYYVFLVPVNSKIDLKKAANAVGEKKINLLKQSELLPLTGYVHGGCSPIGMKKNFPTIIDESAKQFDTILFSAGKIGYQIETSTQNLAKVISFRFADVKED